MENDLGIIKAIRDKIIGIKSIGFIKSSLLGVFSQENNMNSIPKFNSSTTNADFQDGNGKTIFVPATKSMEDAAKRARERKSQEEHTPKKVLVITVPDNLRKLAQSSRERQLLEYLKQNGLTMKEFLAGKKPKK